MNKAMKKDISIAALIAIAFMVSIYVLGSLEYGDAIMMALAAGVILFLNRKELPERWPVQEGWPLVHTPHPVRHWSDLPGCISCLKRYY